MAGARLPGKYADLTAEEARHYFISKGCSGDFIDAMLAEAGKSERRNPKRRDWARREKHARRDRFRRLQKRARTIADAIKTAKGKRLERLPARLRLFAGQLREDFGKQLGIGLYGPSGKPIWDQVQELACDLEAVRKSRAKEFADDPERAIIKERLAVAREIRGVIDGAFRIFGRYRDRTNLPAEAENALERHVREFSPRRYRSELAALLGDDVDTLRRRLARRRKQAEPQRNIYTLLLAHVGFEHWAELARQLPGELLKERPEKIRRLLLEHPEINSFDEINKRLKARGDSHRLR